MKVWHVCVGVMLNTSTQAFCGPVPEIAKSSEGTVAVTWAALVPEAGTKVTGRFVVTLLAFRHWTEVQGRMFA